MSDMRIAKQVQIDSRGLIIDGERFPFFIAEGPIEVQTDELGLPSVIRVGILADSVHIDPHLDTELEGKVQLIRERTAHYDEMAQS